MDVFSREGPPAFVIGIPSRAHRRRFSLTVAALSPPFFSPHSPFASLDDLAQRFPNARCSRSRFLLLPDLAKAQEARKRSSRPLFMAAPPFDGLILVDQCSGRPLRRATSTPSRLLPCPICQRSIRWGWVLRSLSSRRFLIYFPTSLPPDRHARSSVRTFLRPPIRFDVVYDRSFPRWFLLYNLFSLLSFFEEPGRFQHT